MKRQLIAALLALNVAAVAVPSATFTVSAADSVVAQTTDEDLDTAQREAVDAINTEFTTVNTYNEKVTAKQAEIKEKAITDIQKSTDATEIGTIVAKAKENNAALMDAAEATRVSKLIDNDTDYQLSDYYNDTQLKITEAKTEAKKPIAGAVLKSDVKDCYSVFVGLVKDLPRKADVKQDALDAVEEYKKADILKYSTANRDLIDGKKTTARDAIEAADTTTAVTEAVNAMKTAIDAIPTMSQEEVIKELNQYKTDKKAELDRYVTAKLTGSYTNVQKSQINKFADDAKTVIDKAETNDKAKVDAAYAEAVKNIDSVLTKEDAEKAANAVIAEMKAIGTVTSSNYNDKYAAIKAAADDYAKLEEGSEGKGKVDADAIKADFDAAKTAYDNFKKEELSSALKMIDLDNLTYENRAEFKAKLDQIAEGAKTLFTPNGDLNTAVSAAQARYDSIVSGHLAQIKNDYTTAIGASPVSNVIAGTVEVKDENKAAVENAIKLYNEVSELTKGTDKWLSNNAVSYNKLVAALKAYTDKQEAAAAKFDLAKAKVTVSETTAEYTGSAICPAVSVVNVDNVALTANKDYIVAYENNINAGTASVVVMAANGSEYKGNISATFEITPKALTNAKVSAADMYYKKGVARNATEVVTLAGKDLAKGTDYTVTYSNNKNVGKATVKITGTNNYKGEATGSYVIKPAKATIKSVKAAKKKVTVKVEKQTGAKYQIAYKVKGGKYKTVKTSDVSKTIKSLKSKKSYSVKVRAYKVIDGKTYYGKYSAVKTVKVK